MNKGVALVPMLLLLVPGVFIGSGLAVRKLHVYYPLFAVLMVALIINIALMVWHRNKEHPHK